DPEDSPEGRIHSGCPDGCREWTSCSESTVTVYGRRTAHGHRHAARQQAGSPCVCWKQRNPARQKRHWGGDLVHLEGIDDGSGFSPCRTGWRSAVFGMVTGRLNWLIMAAAC